ncbi:TATA element modulatory factor 1 TATA binding family protein [Penicillium digitatum]|uniref:DUF7905 domain-containing protein n=3 Tax=Penicillium digitatum TaxID=36651 RepID=K9GWM7_PEND2|nr:hypothetical protein PDIP_31150 [Penicillium digitatum Pd1]EKV17436.1 hypothetical protein PDIG_15600 [Penicillium digitatum PHI26]EKV17600.1 hypothetical protein PDIP_31150 [Penicillium digitatum Pd1]QQK46800.1 TATA element modulatory factor 1 TATA binding family protein [Penicillium digitatum]
MEPVPQSYENDWERFNAKSWELPNYGPGPDFDRGTIYRQDSDDWAGYKGPDYHVEDDLEDVNYDSPAVDYPPQPTTTKGPVTEQVILRHKKGQYSMSMSPKRAVPKCSPDSHITRHLISNWANIPLSEGAILADRDHGVSPKKAVIIQVLRNTDLIIYLSHQGKMTLIPRQSGARAFLQMLLIVCLTSVKYFKQSEQVTSGETSSIDFRQTIIEATGAYVRISAGNAKLVHIWGQRNQVLAAQNMLQGMLNRLMQQFALPKASRWAKIHAHSNTKVAHARSQEYHDERLSEMRKPPRIVADYTLAFLWPSDGPSLSYFITAQRELLDFIRLKYDAKIYIKPGIPDCLFMSGSDERDMYIIAARFRELWERLMVQHETEIRLFLVAAPRTELMRTHVILQKFGQLSRPALCGPQLAPDVAATWMTTAEEIKAKNRSIVTTGLREALNVIPQFRGFLQMRAKFGSFALQQWRRPKDGISYEFSEFHEMLTHTNTEGRLVPGIRLQQDEIFDRIMKSDFLKPWGNAKTKSLLSLMPRYSANFEYQVNNDLVIHVEAKFSLPLGSQEFEVNGIRCFRSKQIGAPVDHQTPIQISMIDFERSDWQLEVKAFELCPEREMPPELDKFMRSISFQWNPNAKSIGCAPQRKARFSYGLPVKRFVEKASIQLQVKSSPHVFELARFDEYIYAAGHWPITPKVSWGAWLFNPIWDDILCEQADLEISKDGCLSVFFPPLGDDQEQKDRQKPVDEIRKNAEIRKIDEEKQLGAFMSVVQQTARMLANSDTEMPEVLEIDLGSLF